jgi:acyl-CoA synthetase (AMP-forming)/AMP-acid ligase II
MRVPYIWEKITMNMVDIITKNARMYPNEIAFVEVRPVTKVKRAIRWAQFSERLNRLANALLDRGVKKGNKIFIYGRNSINWLQAYFAVMATGAWAVPLNYRFTAENIGYCANIAKPVAFFLDEEYAEMIRAIRSDLTTVSNYICIGSFKRMESMEDLIERASPKYPGIEIKGEDECALYFTSGTTGAPKPVLHLHRNLVCVALNEVTNDR